MNKGNNSKKLTLTQDFMFRMSVAKWTKASFKKKCFKRWFVFNVCRCLWRPEEGARPFSTGTTGSVAPILFLWKTTRCSAPVNLLNVFSGRFSCSSGWPQTHYTAPELWSSFLHLPGFTGLQAYGSSPEFSLVFAIHEDPGNCQGQREQPQPHL